MGQKVHKAKVRIDSALHSRRGKNLLLYLMCVAVAYCFWLMLSFDSEVHRDFEIQVEITDCPENITVIEESPKVLVRVKAKGVQMLKYTWGAQPKLKINFNTYATDDNRIYVSRTQLTSLINEYFGHGISISSIKPDSLDLTYTTRPGVPVKVRVVSNVQAAAQSVINGDISSDIDSVLVYSVGTIPASLTEIVTDSIVLTDLKDSLVREVNLRPVKGMKIIPEKVNVTVPVEPLISKKQVVPIIVENVPKGVQMITFPAKIEINFLVPMSAYKQEHPVSAVVDYLEMDPDRDKVAVKLASVPGNYHNISFKPDSVEYLIER